MTYGGDQLKKRSKQRERERERESERERERERERKKDAFTCTFIRSVNFSQKQNKVWNTYEDVRF